MNREEALTAFIKAGEQLQHEDDCPHAEGKWDGGCTCKGRAEVSEVRVVICGCDDLTAVVIEAAEAELEFLKKLALLVNEASTYGCMPSMSIDDEYIKEDSEGEQK